MADDEDESQASQDPVAPLAATVKERLGQYRALLAKLEVQSQTSYDKAILTLSGGALGVTVTFIEKVVKNPVALEIALGSWICWSVSLTCVLYSFYASTKALRHAILKLDKGELDPDEPGGWAGRGTEVLNFASGFFFLAGTFMFVLFMYRNGG
jgi:hypothetical protein